MLRYVSRLNAAFARFDVKFGTVAITPDESGTATDRRSARLRALKFTVG